MLGGIHTFSARWPFYKKKIKKNNARQGEIRNLDFNPVYKIDHNFTFNICNIVVVVRGQSLRMITYLNKFMYTLPFRLTCMVIMLCIIIDSMLLKTVKCKVNVCRLKFLK